MPKAHPRRSFEYEKLLKLLTHEWRDAEEVIAEITKQLPRASCIRTYRENNRSSGARQYSEEQEFLMGARQLINTAISSAANAENILVRTIGENRRNREIRLNVFDAEYIDNLIAKTQEAQNDLANQQAAALAPAVFVPVDEIFPIMLDHRSVQQYIQVKGHTDTRQVQMTILDAIETADNRSSHDLHILLTAPAADHLSDQLGFQAVHVRNGQLNPRKAIIPTAVRRG